MAQYNFSNLTSSNDYTGFFTFANSSTGYVFGWFILVVIYIVTFIAMKDYPISRAHTAASFIVVIMAFLLQTFNAVPDLAVTFFALICAGGLAWIVMTD